MIDKVKLNKEAIRKSLGLQEGETAQLGTKPTGDQALTGFVDKVDKPDITYPSSQLSDIIETPTDDIITSDTLVSQTPIVDIPEVEVSDTPQITPPPPTPPPIEPKEDPYAIAKEYIDSLEAPESTADPYIQAQQDADFQARQQKANQINAQINNIINQGRAASLKLESEASGKNITTAFLGRQQQEINRQTAIQALPLQMQADIANNNLIAAQSNLETIFKLRSDDAKNLNDFNNKIADLVFNVATAEQQNILNAQIRKENRDYQTTQSNITNARNVTNSILQSQPELASQMSQIDWTSPTAQQDFAKLQSQISEDPMDALNVAVKQAQLKKLQAETAQIGQPTAADRKAQREQEQAETEALRTVDGQTETLRTKLRLIETIQSKSTQLATRVGTNPLSRISPNWLVKFFQLDPVGFAKGKEFAGYVHQLASKEFVDTLIESKKQGAAYGQLSNQEGDDLRAAATAINDWEFKDKDGNKLGIWNVSEKAFNAELNKIKDLANTAIIRSEGSLLDYEEQSLLDDIYNNKDASVYY